MEDKERDEKLEKKLLLLVKKLPLYCVTSCGVCPHENTCREIIAKLREFCDTLNLKGEMEEFIKKVKEKK